jgi:hypothetical protein
MPVCVFEAQLTGPAVRVNGVAGLVLAKSGTLNNSAACDFVMLTNAEYDQIYHAVLVGSPGVPQPFDPVQGGSFFFFGFGVVVFAYLLGFVVAAVRKPIRQGGS